MATMNVSITSEIQHWIDLQVTSGHFANDYIRDVIRMALIESEMSSESSLTVANK